MKKWYLIENHGCDATIYGVAYLEEDELSAILNFARNLNRNSYYGCMPTIGIYPLEEKEIRAVSAIELEIDDIFDDGYIDQEKRMWWCGDCYTFADENAAWKCDRVNLVTLTAF